MDNATYAAYMESVIPNFRGFELAVDDVIVDEVGKKVCLWGFSLLLPFFFFVSIGFRACRTCAIFIPLNSLFSHPPTLKTN